MKNPMTLPDKAIEAVSNLIYPLWLTVFSEIKAKEMARSVADGAIQAAINSLWTPFDPQDPETWPKSEYAPSGDAWLYRYKTRFGIRCGSSCFINGKFRDYAEDEVADHVFVPIDYMDPIHITPTETE